MHATDLQLQTLRLYGEVVSRADQLADRFVFTAGAQVSTTGLAAAVSIAGGTSLLVDPDATAVKSAFRQGGLDFVVNTLDEALRVVKNEIRKHTPLSVALTAEPDAVIAEAQERGLRPALQIQFSPGGEHPRLARHRLDLSTEAGLIRSSPHALQWLASRGWVERIVPAATSADLRALDVRLIQTVADNVRLQWLRRIPHYQRPAPDTGRVVWLTPAEAATFAA